jgi:uncharacterized MAPEG superfamily protein
MPLVELVAMLAALQLIFFGVMCGAARRKAGLKAPAVTGDEGFERAYRVQVNTVELIIAFLPALIIAGRYWSDFIVAGIGAIYLVGRMIYWRSYVSAPESRSLGFALSMLPTLALVILALIGIVMALF